MSGGLLLIVSFLYVVVPTSEHPTRYHGRQSNLCGSCRSSFGNLNYQQSKFRFIPQYASPDVWQKVEERYAKHREQSRKDLAAKDNQNTRKRVQIAAKDLTMVFLKLGSYRS